LRVIEVAAVQELLGRWWWNYDEGDFALLRSVLAADVHFTCRTDTGATDFEEFVRADVRGRDEVMAWQSAHRLDSPYPLRHHGTNIHLVERGEHEASFASYIHVTHHVDGQCTNLSSAIVNGRVTFEDGELRISALEVVLDTMSSGLFRDVRELRT
jgi:SnoaL-like domain